MATYVRDIITASLQDLGVIASDEVPSSADSDVCLKSLNRLIQSWQNDSLMIYSILNQIFPFVSGQGVYTIGPGGNFNTQRPVEIVDAYVRDQFGNDYPMYISNQEEYSEIITKYTQSPLPTVMYPDGNYPLVNLTFWPIPDGGGYSANLWMWQKIQEFTSINDTVVLPPGYERAFEFNLAVEVAPKFGKTVSQDILRIATDSKVEIERTNYVDNQIRFDPTLTERGRVFNWLSGGY